MVTIEVNPYRRVIAQARQMQPLSRESLLGDYPSIGYLGWLTVGGVSERPEPPVQTNTAGA